MKPFFRIFLLLSILVCSFTFQAEAQRERGKTAKEQMKEQQKKKQERKQKIEGELKMKREHHLEIQDKKTRKRMKRTRRKSERARKGKPLPFYKRWFRKKTFK